MIEDVLNEIIESLAARRISISNQIDFLNDLSKNGEHVGTLEEKSNSDYVKHHFFYYPIDRNGIVIHHNNNGLHITSRGDIDKEEFTKYYKIKEKKEKTLKSFHKLFPFSYLYLKNLKKREESFEKKYAKRRLFED